MITSQKYKILFDGAVSNNDYDYNSALVMVEKLQRVFYNSKIGIKKVGDFYD